MAYPRCCGWDDNRGHGRAAPDTRLCKLERDRLTLTESQGVNHAIKQ